MIILDDSDQPVHATKDFVSRFEALLGVKLKDVDRYFPEQEQDDESDSGWWKEGNDLDEENYWFEGFFSDQLVEKDRLGIYIDWQWQPAELFRELRRVLPEHTLELLDYSYSQDDRTYTLVFKLDGIFHHKTVPFPEPNQLIEVINTQLKDKQFIEMWFGGDDLSWLLVPRNLDIRAFCELTGFTERPEKPQKFVPAQSDYNPHGKQSKKIFFWPKIYIGKGDQSTLLPTYWAGRVLPGQTFREGVRVELAKMQSYHGQFEYSDVEFRDITQDNQGRDIQRFSVIIVLLDKPGR